MDNGRLQAILGQEIDDAIGMLDSDTTAERAKALDYYLRRPMGTEIEGRSQIVTAEVAEAVDGALPQLIRVFTASDDIVRFEPVGPGDEESARQATEYANWVFYKDNPGFALLHSWFKDALLAKTGTLKAVWEEKIDVDEEAYRGLSDNELALLLSDGTREIVAQDSQHYRGAASGRYDGAVCCPVARCCSPQENQGWAHSDRLFASRRTHHQQEGNDGGRCSVRGSPQAMHQD